MNEELEQFAFDLMKEIALRTQEEGSGFMSEEAFTEVVIEGLTDHGHSNGLGSDQSGVCHCRVEAKGSKPGGKMSAWALSNDGLSLDLYVSQYHGQTHEGDRPLLSTTEVKDLIKSGVSFFKRCRTDLPEKMEESHPAYGAVRAIGEAARNLQSLEVIVLTDGLAKGTESGFYHGEDLEIRYQVWGIERLQRVTAGPPEAIRIDFNDGWGNSSGPIPCLTWPDPTGEYKTYLAFLPGHLLAKVYDKYRQRLLEKNVRSYLQARGAVNRGIRQTLREEPNRFLAYNNGLCCTALRVGIREVGNGHAVLDWVEDFQIVNGGQTTASVYYAWKDQKVDIDIDQVTIQVKLTVLENSDQTAEFVPLIAQYANSQNKVSTADLYANGKYHTELEQRSRAEWTPTSAGATRQTRWFYERARGSYNVDKLAQGTPARQKLWAAMNPLKQKITKTDLAKYLQAWDGKPYWVCRGAEKNFKNFAEEMAAGNEPVVDRTYFRRVVAKAILWKEAEVQFGNLGLTGFRAIAVAYTIAWLAEESNRCIDLDEIWREQNVPRPLARAMSDVLKAAHQFILEKGEGTNPEGPPKKQEFWKEFRQRPVHVDKAWKQDLLDQPLTDAVTGIEATEQEWRRLCQCLGNDGTRLAELVVGTRKRVPPQFRHKSMAVLSVYESWEAMRNEFRITQNVFRTLVDAVSAAERRMDREAATGTDDNV